MIHSRNLTSSETRETGFAIQDESEHGSHDEQRTRQVMLDGSTAELLGNTVKSTEAP